MFVEKFHVLEKRITVPFIDVDLHKSSDIIDF